MRKRFLVAGLALAVVATALVGITHRPGTVQAAGSAICVKDNTTLCLYLTGDLKQAGTSIVLETVGVPVQDAFLWHLDQVGTVNSGTFPGIPGLQQRYGGDPIYKIEKTLPTGGHDGCISASGTNTLFGGYYVWKLTWQDCSAGNTEWVESDTNYFSSVGVDNEQGIAYVMSADTSSGCDFSNGATVYVTPSGGSFCNIQFA
jgi:hypothetical protein